MKNKYKSLAQNVFFFSLGGFVPKILSLLLVPIYTRYLTTAEYGISDLIITTVSLLLPFFTLDIQDAVMRFVMEKDTNPKDVFSIGIRIDLIGIGIVALCGFLVNCFAIAGVSTTYIFFTVVMFATTALNNNISLFCRGIDQVKATTNACIINSVVMLSSNILLLTCFHMGLIGFLIANTIGNFVSIIYIFIKAKLYNYIKKPFVVSRDLQRKMISYSSPLILSVAAWWVNNTSDRYILSLIAGVSASGIYAVAYKIPNLLSTFENILSQAWSISAIQEYDKQGSEEFISKVFSIMSFGMLLACSVLIILDIPISKVLYAKEFFEAWKFVPPLLLSVVFEAMSLFVGSLFTAIKNTKSLAITTIIGAGVNTIFNFILIPKFGAYGASIATVFGYAVVFIMRFILLKKYVTFSCNKKRDFLAYGALILQVIVAFQGWRFVPYQLISTFLIAALYRKEIHNMVQKIRGMVQSSAR